VFGEAPAAARELREVLGGFMEAEISSCWARERHERARSGMAQQPLRSCRRPTQTPAQTRAAGATFLRSLVARASTACCASDGQRRDSPLPAAWRPARSLPEVIDSKRLTPTSPRLLKDTEPDLLAFRRQGSPESTVRIR
jgi:hypothetical protein